jgi:hypothetical protein
MALVNEMHGDRSIALGTYLRKIILNSQELRFFPFGDTPFAPFHLSSDRF